MTKKANNKEKLAKQYSEKKSILLQVDEATKGIMEEIQTGITDDIINTMEEQKRIIKELNEKIEDTYKLEKENNRLLKKIVKNFENTEE